MMLARIEDRPRAGDHVAEHWLLPRVLRVRLKKRRGKEAFTTRMSAAGDKGHSLRHFTVHGFALHGPTGISRTPIPFRDAARRSVGMSAKRVLVSFMLLQISVVVV